ncbi:structural maintenance of chromosome 2 [Nematocida sp. ERTm5]|nr:structural maintenance of chromosome 2 [Nematocida sp. ERTm5]
MHLESIEVEGFKSYGTRTVISPMDKSFTAITGLNGTGKSNILDAICFVLGVDTPRLLRSSSMKDLIFKQSKTTSGSAKVSLVFNNKEKERGPIGYTEVDTIKLTRIITEDGKTKYLLNDHNVSTKTVTRLLQCVGLSSSKAGYTPGGGRVEKQAPYFIVMQGRVSRILSMKSTQFLTLLEECSGTSVYRTEKYKAYSTLEKKQKKLLETKDTLSKTIFPFLERLRKERDDYYAHKEAAEKKLALEAALVKCKSSLEYKEAEEAIEEREGIQRRLYEIEKEIEEKTREIVDVDVVDVDIAGIQERIDSRNREIAKLMIDVEEEEALAAQKQINKKEKEIERILTAYEEIVKSMQMHEEDDQRENTIEEMPVLGAEKAKPNAADSDDKKAEIERTLTRLEAKESALMQADRQRDSLAKERKREGLSAQLDDISKELLRVQEKCELGKRQGMSEEKARANIEAHKKHPVRSLDEIRREIDRMKRELGYPVRDGVYGKVKELIEIIDVQHEVSVGVVLGARKEYLVVENEAVGKSVIEEVSREGRRIDVIPLNKIVGRRIEPKKEDRAREYGSIPLIEAVNYPAEIKKAMEYLLGGYILSKERSTAIKLRDNEGITSVTIDGELFDKRGTITGGSIDRNKYRFNKTTKKDDLLTLQKEERTARAIIQQCSFKELSESQEYLKLLTHQQELLRQAAQTKAEIDALGRETVQEDEIKGLTQKIHRLTEVKNSLSAKYAEKEKSAERLKEISEKLKEAKKREEQLKEEIKRDEALKFEGIKNNEVNRARRSIQIKERRRIEMDIDQIKKEKIKHEIRYKKIENVTLGDRKARSKKTKAELETELLQIQEELNYIRTIPRKDINKKNIEILQKNEEIELELKERIKKLQIDKETIEESLKKLNTAETETIEEIFHSVNKRIGRYIKYFIPNADAKLESVNGSVMHGVELHVKIGTWKKGLTELSGGQRSLCALSLIFALLKTKPSPLYILDEIDAALDASHTEAMGRMIQNEFVGSQFVVVSLKDGMYHNANVLFQTYIREGTSGVRRM